MAGLLNGLFATPSDQAMFSLGAGLLGSSPRLRPVGQALLGSMDQYNNASEAQQRRQQDAMRQQMLQMQMLELQRQQAQAQQRRDMARQFHQSPQAQAGSLLGGPTHANAERIPGMTGGFDAAGYQQALLGQGDLEGAAGANAWLPKAPEEYTLAPGAARYKGGQVVAQNAASDKDDELVRIMRAANIDPLSPVGQQLLQDRARKIATHAPGTNVTVGLQAPYAGTDSQGNPIVVQPTNRPGAPPQVLTGPDGKPMRPPQSPAQAQAEAAAAKKAEQRQTVLGLVAEAESLVDVATGSLLGAGRDRAAAALGYAGTPAQASAKLKVIQANLMLKQPRMEGPQSDRDVVLYREMAGQIGDPMVPAPIKKAALATIKKLNAKYAADAPAANGFSMRRLP